GGAGEHRAVAAVGGAHRPVLADAVHHLPGGACEHLVALLPAEQHLPAGRDLPQPVAGAGVVHRHPGGVPVVDALVVAADHPRRGAGAAPGPLELVLVVDGGDAALGVGDAEHPVVHVQPEDVDVVGDLVGGVRDLAAQLVDLAVVAAGVDPEVVGDDALDAVGQPVAGGHPAVVRQRVDVPGLVADPGALVVDEDAERGAVGAEPPQHRRLPGRRAVADDLPPGHRAALALPLHGGLVALAELLRDLLRGGGLGLGDGGVPRGAALPRLADPPVADGHLGAVHDDLVELVCAAALLGEFEVGSRLDRAVVHAHPSGTTGTGDGSADGIGARNRIPRTAPRSTMKLGAGADSSVQDQCRRGGALGGGEARGADYRPAPPRWTERRVPEYVRKWAERTLGSAEGVDPVDHLDQAPALDAAIAASWLFCPETVEYRGGIFLKRRFSSANVDRRLEEHDLKTTQATVNLQYLGSLFPHVESAESDA